ncbi:hypothetical protein ACFUCV_04215 [Specibacter sp. NPDC057265]|uniref:hypothetical protein n=1 Tax=Specibacter sp. NPDC057265 TaxID=3346075 RepID=UPI0036361C58
MTQSNTFPEPDTGTTPAFGPPGPQNSQPDTAEHDPVAARFLAAFPATRVAWRTVHFHEAGFSDRAIGRLVAAGALMRIHYGTYVRRSHWDLLSVEAQERTFIVLHDFGTRGRTAAGFIYSHASAARLHRLKLWRADKLLHITQTTKPSSTGCNARTRIHTAPLAPCDVTAIAALRVTTLERTVVDCCLTMSYKQGLIVADDALRRGASLPLLQHMAAGLPRHRGVRNLRKVLAHADGRSESPGETLTRDLLRELGIEPPLLQHWIDTRRGRYRVDFAWPRKRVVLEFDGRVKYFDYGPTDEAVFLERKRERALMEAGWKVLRIEWKDLFNEGAFRARVLAALGS